MGGDETEIVDKRNTLRKQIKANLVAAAAASGKDLEGSEDDGLLDASDDDFFLHGSSSDEADADDEWTDKVAREQASSASGSFDRSSFRKRGPVDSTTGNSGNQSSNSDARKPRRKRRPKKKKQ